MRTEYAQMPPHSRTWVYQSDREFTDEEIKSIQQKADQFTEEWTAHNLQLRACCVILHKFFIVLIVDEQQAEASGCSIHKSVHFLKKLETEYHISLFDRMKIAYKVGDKIHLSSRYEFEKLQTVNEHTIVFNNLIGTKRELESSWEIPLKDSWVRTSP